jgi:hypothetical protein
MIALALILCLLASCFWVGANLAEKSARRAHKGDRRCHPSNVPA